MKELTMTEMEGILDKSISSPQKLRVQEKGPLSMIRSNSILPTRAA